MQNKKTLKIGSSDFKDIIEGNNYFVDKSLLIKDFYQNSNDIILMPRPRRFGKTLNLSMLEYFFDINKNGNNNLFSHLKISKNKSFCETHQNKHPVINITLKNVDENNWGNCLESLKSLISEELYEKHSYLLDSTKLSFLDKKNFKDILLEKASLSKYKKSIFYLSKYLRKHFNKKVIILVDEYDAPIINAFRNSNFDFEKKYYNNVINFMQTFLGSVFKGNEENLQKGLLTGVMRVGKESLFSKWNNLDVFPITSKYFSEYFGFTEKETKDLLSYFNLESNFENVKKWYDGYVFGDTDKIYNPWSIVNYISDNEEDFKAYWVNTSADTLIREKISDYLLSSQAYWYWTTIIVTLTTVLLVFTVPENAYPLVYARYILGSIYVLWLPGYTFIKALFPEKELDNIERVALSIGLSLAPVPLVGLFLNYTPWGIRLTPITLSLLALTITFATAAIIREHQTN